MESRRLCVPMATSACSNTSAGSHWGWHNGPASQWHSHILHRVSIRVYNGQWLHLMQAGLCYCFIYEAGYIKAHNMKFFSVDPSQSQAGSHCRRDQSTQCIMCEAKRHLPVIFVLSHSHKSLTLVYSCLPIKVCALKTNVIWSMYLVSFTTGWIFMDIAALYSHGQEDLKPWSLYIFTLTLNMSII